MEEIEENKIIEKKDDSETNFGGCSASEKRDYAIDILRIISLLLIFLAHTSLKNDSAGLLFNIRAFDVVAMVFVSGLSFVKSHKAINSTTDYLIYIKKRFFRLIVPAWVFITIYILFSFLISFAIPNDNYELKKVLLSYSLISGIGYVWIVRIFFCIAMVAPFIKLFCEKIKNQYFSFLIFLVLASLLTIASYYSSSLTGYLSIIINILLIPFLSYSAVYFLAISYSKMNVPQKAISFFILLALTVSFSVVSGFKIDLYKYPPAYLYLTYGCCCSIFLYEIILLIVRCTKLEANHLISKAIIWLSKSCFLLYFVHLFFVFLIDNDKLTNNFAIQFLIVFFGTILISIPISLIWEKTKNKLFKKNKYA